MFSNNYEIDVKSTNITKFKKKNFIYYSLLDQSEYNVQLKNRTKNKVNAFLYIDNVLVSEDVVEPFSHTLVKTKFKFINKNTFEAHINKSIRGYGSLIKVKFMPCDTELIKPVSTVLSEVTQKLSREVIKKVQLVAKHQPLLKKSPNTLYTTQWF